MFTESSLMIYQEPFSSSLFCICLLFPVYNAVIVNYFPHFLSEFGVSELENMPDQNPLKNKQYIEVREPICKLSGTIDLNRGLSWVTQKMCTIFHICASSYAQDCHCPSDTQGPEAEPSCLVPGSGRRRVPGWGHLRWASFSFHSCQIAKRISSPS